MAQQSTEQKKTVSRVMHEYKHGELERGRGGKVKSRRQAVAIALSEAGASNQESPRENRRHYAHTKRKERRGETAQQEKEGRRAMDRSQSRRRRSASAARRTGGGRTRAQLYQEAQRRKIPGRSKMNKAQLERALRG
ncbi:MAG TPA: DUF6496 domain-containing protein [Acetobacteraceae bacterium]|nr:DUF6496 domain-containing protein [Acetobacteraceae bacterium]